MNKKEERLLDDVISEYKRQLSNIVQATDEEQLELLSCNTRESRNRVIESNLILVMSVAKKYRRSARNGIEFCDMIQEGNMGLIHAIDLFDMRYGTKFSTFAVFHIRDRIVRYIRKSIRQQCENIDDVRMIYEMDDISMDLSVLNTLSYIEKEVLSLRWGCHDGMQKTEDVVGQYIGKSKARCCQIENKAIRKLKHPGRKYLLSEGLAILDL